MKTSAIHEILVAAIKARKNILIVGAPGTGKTEIECAAALEAKSLNYIMHPSVGDPTDAKGFPFVIDGQATFIPFNEMKAVYDAVEMNLLVTLFLDDLGQGMPATQASYMPVLDKLKGKASVIAATNRRTDRAGVSGLLEPIKSRFHSIINVEASVEDWCAWAIDNNIAPELIAFIRLRTELLHQFTATQDLVNQPSPRTWAHVNDFLEMHLSASSEFEAISGSVGEGPAAEFIGFLRLYRDMPSLDSIILDPKGSDVPSKPDLLYAVSVGLASKVTVQNFRAITTYADRMLQAQYGEFAALLLRDCVKRNRKLCDTDTFIKHIAPGTLGKLMMGR